jgi:calcineurin-like phosphoesterase family protein
MPGGSCAQSIWHLADPHFVHPNCAGWRGFASAEEHDAALLARCQQLISPDARVVIHGDLGLKSETRILELAAQIPGEKHILLGNHDRLHPMHRGHASPARQAKWAAVFGDRISQHCEAAILGRRVRLSHFPYAGEGDHTITERYSEWRLPDEGDWLLCGHVHHRWLIRGRQINVGVDQWGLGPVPCRVLTDMLLVTMQIGVDVEAEMTAVRDRWLVVSGATWSPPPRDEPAQEASDRTPA